ncbi:MAG: hypothetical protein M1835_002915 [Candelina submexicana]|nr:MAG: hypothetical protein M1835_002915 [Candelina submexicana]
MSTSPPSTSSTSHAGRENSPDIPAAGYLNYNLACSKRCLKSLRSRSKLSRDFETSWSASASAPIDPICFSCYQLLVDRWAHEIRHRDFNTYKHGISDDEKKIAKAALEHWKKERDGELRAFDLSRLSVIAEGDGKQGRGVAPSRKSSLRVTGGKGKRVRFE